MEITTKPSRYCSYLLRCWAEHSQATNSMVWRFSLEDPHTGQRQGFASLATLVAAIQGELIKSCDDEPARPDTSRHAEHT